MLNLNRVELIGFVACNPSFSITTTKQKRVANFRLGTTKTWKKADQRHEHAEFHPLSAYMDGLVNVIDKHVRQGDYIRVVGSLRHRSFEKEGVKCYATEIVIDELNFLERAPDKGGNPSGWETAGETDDEIPY